MSKTMIVGNWKMNTSYSEAMILANAISKHIEKLPGIEVVLCPPSIYLYPVYESLKAKSRNLSLGLQNAMWEDEGAFTGEISVQMAKGIAKYVILGHSERRSVFNESNKQVNEKIKNALKNHFKAIVCVGEREMYDLENNYAFEIKKMEQEGGILYDLKESLSGIAKGESDEILIAYEPVWAIGTGNSASAIYCGALSTIIKDNLQRTMGLTCRVLYGGSVCVKNSREFTMQPSIDGLLIGSQSLNLKNFLKICKNSMEG